MAKKVQMDSPEKERYTNFQIPMRNLKLVLNKTLTLAEVFMIAKIFGTSMEISNLSALGDDVLHKSSLIVVHPGQVANS
jgi:hypothetical protein